MNKEEAKRSDRVRRNDEMGGGEESSYYSLLNALRTKGTYGYAGPKVVRQTASTKP